MYRFFRAVLAGTVCVGLITADAPGAGRGGSNGRGGGGSSGGNRPAAGSSRPTPPPPSASRPPSPPPRPTPAPNRGSSRATPRPSGGGGGGSRSFAGTNRGGQGRSGGFAGNAGVPRTGRGGGASVGGGAGTAGRGRATASGIAGGGGRGRSSAAIGRAGGSFRGPSRSGVSGQRGPARANVNRGNRAPVRPSGSRVAGGGRGRTNASNFAGRGRPGGAGAVRGRGNAGRGRGPQQIAGAGRTGVGNRPFSPTRPGGGFNRGPGGRPLLGAGNRAGSALGRGNIGSGGLGRPFAPGSRTAGGSSGNRFNGGRTLAGNTPGLQGRPLGARPGNGRTSLNPSRPGSFAPGTPRGPLGRPGISNPRDMRAGLPSRNFSANGIAGGRGVTGSAVAGRQPLTQAPFRTFSDRAQIASGNSIGMANLGGTARGLGGSTVIPVRPFDLGSSYIGPTQISVPNGDGTSSTYTFSQSSLDAAIDQAIANQQTPLPPIRSALQDPGEGLNLLGTMALAGGVMAGGMYLAPEALPLLGGAADVLGTAADSAALFYQTPTGQILSSYALSQLGSTGLPSSNIYQFIGGTVLPATQDYLGGTVLPSLSNYLNPSIPSASTPPAAPSGGDNPAPDAGGDDDDGGV